MSNKIDFADNLSVQPPQTLGACENLGKPGSIASDSKKSDSNKTAANLLLASAMALPIYSQAASMPEKESFSYRYSQYVEDEADESKVVSGDLERFEINVHQFKLVKFIGEDSTLTIDALTETLGGASPWGTQQGQNGEPELIMSGASISESRNDLSLAYTTFHESRTDTISAGVSVENDYQAVYFGADYEWSFNQKNTSLAIGGSISADELSPSDALEYGRIESENKQRVSLFFGLSQILSSKSIVSLSYSHSLASGYLSDPYKLGDTRPNKRNSHIFAGKYRQFIDSLNGALHLDYRYYQDDWEMQSNTFVLGWHQNVASSFQVIPSIRYYSQTETWFYEPFVTPLAETDFYSSDYRLSPYGAISKKIKVKQRFETWSYTFSFERYEADADYAIDQIELENPALVSFNRISAGFDYFF